MVETVKLRPNHYETLGLTPAASSEEIAEAFAREVNLIPVRPLGTFAQVSAAFEALRDPVRRMAYDATLAPPPKPSHSLIGRLERAPVDEALPSKRARIEQPAPPAFVPPIPQPDPPTHRAQSSPVDPLPPATPKPAPYERQQFHTPEPADQQWLDQVDWQRLELQERADRSLRPAVGGLVINTAVGGALLLAIVLGAWRGFESGNDNRAQDSTSQISLPLDAALPAAEPSPVAAPAAATEEAQPERSQPVPVAVAPAPSARPPLQIELPEQEPARPAPAEQPQSPQAVSADVTGTPSAVATRSPRMPLPEAVIARTIGRIGFACGQVSSTVPMEGEAPGTFKVICTSGDSYRAAPVNGRYRFRRLGG
jgi:hypothetical protein